jgi:hypothetical protein
VEQQGAMPREVSEAVVDLFRDLDVVGVPRGGPMRPCMQALSDFVRVEFRGAVHLGGEAGPGGGRFPLRDRPQASVRRFHASLRARASCWNLLSWAS